MIINITEKNKTKLTMDVVVGSIDHHKEYYYKTTKNGRRMYYHRSSAGHKVIAKANISSHIVDQVQEFDKTNIKQSTDWLRAKVKAVKDLEKWTKALIDIDKYNLSKINYDRSKKVYTDRIASCKQAIKTYDAHNAKQSEERYAEETGKYGGFKNYFKEKYSQFNYKSSDHKEEKPRIPKPRKTLSPYATLREEGILLPTDTIAQFKDVKRRYRRWLVANHPDKGGNDERCAAVIEEYQHFEESCK